MRNIFVEDTDPREFENDALSRLTDTIIEARQRRDMMHRVSETMGQETTPRIRGITYSRTFAAPPAPRHRRQPSL